MPTLDTYVFFLVILSGFALVWSFRHHSESKKAIKDFEYLGFSAFWGLLMITTYTYLIQDIPEQLALLENPFAGGIMLFMFGIFIGWVTGKIAKKYSKSY